MNSINKEKAFDLLEKNFESITYSRNVFIPVTNYCRNNCLYCGFSREEKKLLGPKEIEALLEEAKKEDAKEALFVFGERPYEINEFLKKLKKLGYNDFLSYLKKIENQAIQNNLIPHTNPGTVSESFISKIRPYNASMGLMLENISELGVHENSPGKNPAERIRVLETLGKKKIPTTTGLLIGIGEEKKDRINSIKKLKELDKRYGHLQEIIIQPYKPNKNSELQRPSPSKKELLETISLARRFFKEKSIQSPPNLIEDPLELIKAGANDFGGISEVTPDYINPNHNWPLIKELREKVIKETAFGFEERLPIYPRYINKEWVPSKLISILNKKQKKD